MIPLYSRKKRMGKGEGGREKRMRGKIYSR